MHTTQNQTPILLAIVMALFLATLPDPTKAQAPPPIGTFNTQNCYNQMQNSYTNMQQAHTVAQQKVISNGPIPNFNVVYCWDSVIKPLINSISILTTLWAANNGSASIWTVISPILQQWLQQIAAQIVTGACQIFSQAVQQATAMLKNWMCIPMPHFSMNLNLSSFSQLFGNSHNYQGLNLLNLAGVAPNGRVQVPNVFQLWNMNGQY
jgi:hypothetical protein